MSNYIRTKQKQDCCGCGACVAACPFGCVTLCPDSEGFLYPIISSDCRHCELCETVCETAVNTKNKSSSLAKFGYNNDREIWNISSSGGVFHALAQTFLRNGGVVFGTALSDDNKGAKIVPAYNQIDVVKLIGSKYVQSNPVGAIEKIIEELNLGRDVLFCGTPCQVAGVRSAINHKGACSSKLSTCDFVCHGVVSPSVFSKYISELEEKYMSMVTLFSFRNKKFGWRNYAVLAEFRNGRKYHRIHSQDVYMTGFLSNITLRPSCFNCQYTSLQRSSDITLADFWSIDGYKPSAYNRKGVSAVIINTPKGEAIVESSIQSLNFEECDVNYLKKTIHCLSESVKPSVLRSAFFEEFNQTDSVTPLLRKYAPPVTYRSVIINETKRMIKRILRLARLRK